MSLILELSNHKSWLKFLEYKKSRIDDEKEYSYLKKFIDEKKYLIITSKIINDEYIFSNPIKHYISKRGSNKKRIVYSYKKDEVIIMKFITYLLYKYDSLFNNNCYSFRINISPQIAIKDLIKNNNFNNYYGYKVDISNYFNSINVNILLEKLKIINDEKLLSLFKQILTNENVIYNNQLIKEQKGAIAGCPLSNFFANIYLNDLDHNFSNKEYARYADDILIFCTDKEELNKKINIVKEYLTNHDLKINKEKENYFYPQSKWEFLGFSYEKGIIDISSNTKRKIKAKIKRKARSLQRWKTRKKVNNKATVKSMNKIFNYKFFGGKKTNELNWSKWYFPVINTDKSLKEIDNYYQSYLRYLVVGNFKKNNKIKVKYNYLKECNYKTLVHEFYMYKNNK